MGEEKRSDFTDLITGIEEASENWQDGIDKSLFHVEDRPRGILSDTDREYLCGLRDYKHKQTESNRKQDIRERVINALHDFVLLSLLLDEREQTKIFEEEIKEDDLNMFLESMITFIYTGLNQDKDRFEKIIEKGTYFGANIDQSGRWVGEAVNVDASVDIEYNPDVEKLYKRLRQGDGDQLSPAEIGVLVREGKLEPDDLSALEQSGPRMPSSHVGDDE